MKEDKSQHDDPGQTKRLMRAMSLALSFCLALAASAVPKLARACSIAPFFTPLDAEEIVEAADQILLVRATSFAPDTPTSDPRSARFFSGKRTEAQRAEWGAIIFRVERVLKGTRSDPMFSVFGKPGERVRIHRKPPYDEASGVSTDCGPLSSYEIGKNYLLFVQGERLLNAMWSAVNEEVSGPDDRWVRWVEAELKDDGCSCTTPRRSPSPPVFAIVAVVVCEALRRRYINSGQDDRNA